MLCVIPLILPGVVLISMIQTCVICIFQKNNDEQIEKPANYEL